MCREREGNREEGKTCSKFHEGQRAEYECLESKMMTFQNLSHKMLKFLICFQQQPLHKKLS